VSRRKRAQSFCGSTAQTWTDSNNSFAVAFGDELKKKLPHRLKSVGALPCENLMPSSVQLFKQSLSSVTKLRRHTPWVEKHAQSFCGSIGQWTDSIYSCFRRWTVKEPGIKSTTSPQICCRTTLQKFVAQLYNCLFVIVHNYTLNIVSVNFVICARCKLSLSWIALKVVTVDVLWVVHFPGAKQRIFNSGAQNLLFLVVSTIISEHFGENRVTLWLTVVKLSCIKLWRFFSETPCSFTYAQHFYCTSR